MLCCSEAAGWAIYVQHPASGRPRCAAEATRSTRPTLAPSAGPTGGAGFALPAGNASLISPATASTEQLYLHFQLAEVQQVGDVNM